MLITPNTDHEMQNPDTIVTQDGASQIKFETYVAQAMTYPIVEILKLLSTQFNILNTKIDSQIDKTDTRLCTLGYQLASLLITFKAEIKLQIHDVIEQNELLNNQLASRTSNLKTKINYLYDSNTIQHTEIKNITHLELYSVNTPKKITALE